MLLLIFFIYVAVGCWISLFFVLPMWLNDYEPMSMFEWFLTVWVAIVGIVIWPWSLLMYFTARKENDNVR